MTLVDFYGFGETPPLPYPAYVGDYAKSIADLIRFYKMSSAYVVGHSFGGRVAIRLASEYGYLLDGLVLVDSAGIKPRRGLKYYFKVGTHKLLTKLKLKHTAGSEDYRKLSGVMKETFKNVVNEDQTRELNKITLPTLIVWGDKDKDTPIYMAKRISRNIKNSSLVIFKGEGHFAYLYRNKAFTAILLNFLAEGGYEMDNSGTLCDNLRRNVVKIPRLRAKK